MRIKLGYQIYPSCYTFQIIIFIIKSLITMLFLEYLTKATSIFASSLQTQALLPGTSDCVVVKQKDGSYKSTPFLACFGPYSVLSKQKKVAIYVNNTLISDVSFSLDSHGYSIPMHPSDNQVSKMNLKMGKNQIIYELDNNYKLHSEVHLFSYQDKILISDLDGTLTRNDIGGLVHNVLKMDYLHDGYGQLIRKVQANGYKIVWVTMRSLPMYELTKKYIQDMIGVQGVLLTQPQQFLPAAKKQIFKKTGNIKANLIHSIRNIFPLNFNPFVAGLGNRENDAIAYHHAGIEMRSIFIVDTRSRVHKMDTHQFSFSYKQMVAHADNYFPKHQVVRC